MRTSQLMGKVFLGALCTASTLTLSADVIYDNSRNDLLTRFNPGVLEVGDQIKLAGSARYVTNFAFEYWGENSASAELFSGNVEARVRFYANDGDLFSGYATPKTVIYDSLWFAVPKPTSRNTFQFRAGEDFPFDGLFLPVSSTMTWSVQFQGMESTDAVGVDLYSPASTGQNFPDYWQHEADGWHLMNNVAQMDFAALLEARTVPEPSMLAFAGLGALSLAMARRRRG